MSILCYLYLSSNGTDRLVGTLRFDRSREKEVSSFSYDPSFLRDPLPIRLFDDLALSPLPQYPVSGSFPFVEDMLPDRWGMALLKRKEDRLAKSEGRSARRLFQSDCLLALDDKTRKGALRLKSTPNGEFLAPSSGKPVPPEFFLAHLQELSKSFEEGETINDQDFADILAQGSSLGGARPKANVYGSDGNLYLAKFPSKHDEYDVGAFEKLCNDLARLSLIAVPDSDLRKISKSGSTFVSKRFDRNGSERIHFVSAMCLLGAKDHEEGHSYLDLVTLIRNVSSNPKDDLKELYRRVAFNIAIGNGDDHLRNHGFLFDGKGYRLSPAYDLNPSRFADHLSLAIDGFDRAMSFPLLLKTGRQYDLDEEEAEAIILEVKRTVSENLVPRAKKLGISEGELGLLSSSFDLSKRG